MAAEAPVDKFRPQTFLAQLPLFGAMSEAELDRIALGATSVRLARGAMVFQRGDPCDGFHVVVYGQVKLSFVSAHGAEKVVELIGPRHSFGEAVMFMGKPYIVAAQALEDTLLLHVAKAAIMAEIVHDPALACKMLAGLSRRMHALMGDLESYCLHSGTQRTIGFLLKDDPRDGTLVRLPMSKALVASRLNLTPEHFSRILSDLMAHGLIAVKARNVTILALDGLRRYGS
ncbi:MAG: Crp/Fnr family transcriptional regulator [Pseudomonadota bacterium]|nr:Crp/Fnr family transcriptional regulator [Pseudomonadota bacterium]